MGQEKSIWPEFEQIEKPKPVADPRVPPPGICQPLYSTIRKHPTTIRRCPVCGAEITLDSEYRLSIEVAASVLGFAFIIAILMAALSYYRTLQP
jgi:hypothetical protein